MAQNLVLLFFFSFLGLLSLAKFTASLLYWTYAFFLRPSKDLRSYGSWALVTGAAQGIGKAFAFELASRGLNLVLHDRDDVKLDAVSAEIREKYGDKVGIKKVVIDLLDDPREWMELLRKEVSELDVGVLVNNAGVVSREPVYFHQCGMDVVMGTVKVNLEAMTMVARVVVEGMVQRGRGAILNIGSGSTVAVTSFPFFTIYASTKSYVEKFSRSLYVEYRSKGINVQCQTPLFVDTMLIPEKARAAWYSKIFAPPEAYAQAATRWIGHEPARCIPYLPQFLQCCLARLVPDFIVYPLLILYPQA